VSPRLRLGFALAAIVAAVATGPAGGVAVAVVAIAAVAVERVAARAWRAWRAPALTVAIAVALQAWLNGREAALALGARVAGATAASAWLVATTRPDQIILALRSFGAPATLVELVALAARYVAVLGESLRSAREAQRVRLGWQKLPARLRSFGALGGIALARAIDQSDAIAEAMRARGGGRR
jgi:energy-coupling factor transporter transmembrane protein EcfT